MERNIQFLQRNLLYNRQISELNFATFASNFHTLDSPNPVKHQPIATEEIRQFLGTSFCRYLGPRHSPIILEPTHNLFVVEEGHFLGLGVR